MLGLFNMIPGFPLDGGRVLRSIVWGINHNFRSATRFAGFIGELVAYGFIFYGLFETFFRGDLSGLWLAFIGWFLLNAAQQSVASVIMREQSFARHHFRMTQSLHLHGIIREGRRVDLLEQRTNILLDLRVAFRMDDELLAAADIAHVAIFDHDRAGLDDVARVRERARLMRASTPPAEAPTTIMSCPGNMCSLSGPAGRGSGSRAGPLLWGRYSMGYATGAFLYCKHKSSRILDLGLASVETPDSKTNNRRKSTAQRSIFVCCLFLKAPPLWGGVGEGRWASFGAWVKDECRIRDDL